MKTLWRGVFALVGLFALGLQYGLMIGTDPGRIAALTLNFFSFFTILTNVLVMLAMLLPVVAGRTGVGRAMASSGVRAAVTMYAVVVGLVYHFLLHATWNPQGWLYVVNILLHYVMPSAMLIDWLVFVPRGQLTWRDPARWLLFPLAYGGWTLIHGLASDWWPYWFVNVSELGLARTAAYFAGLLIFFLTIGLVIVAIDRSLSSRDSTPASA